MGYINRSWVLLSYIPPTAGHCYSQNDNEPCRKDQCVGNFAYYQFRKTQRCQPGFQPTSSAHEAISQATRPPHQAITITSLTTRPCHRRAPISSYEYFIQIVLSNGKLYPGFPLGIFLPARPRISRRTRPHLRLTSNYLSKQLSFSKRHSSVTVSTNLNLNVSYTELRLERYGNCHKPFGLLVYYADS